jgi:membrane protease YdiL (CAAX protease family)
MNLGMLVDLSMVVAAFGFGAYAIRHWRRHGQPVLAMLGLGWHRHAPLDFIAGAAITTSAMVCIFAAELALGAIGHGPAPRLSVQDFALLALVKLAHTFKEEFIMRGLLLSGLLLVLRGRVTLAIGLSALAFGLGHLSNPGASALSVLGTALGGVIYGLAFVRTHNLWLPIGLHSAWNFVQGPLLGFPVSGMAAGGLQQVHNLAPAWLTGADYGPEAGLVGILFRFYVIAMVLLWTARRAPAATLAPAAHA